MILVTGGAGYIGGIVAQEVLNTGREVVVLDDLSRGHRDAVPAKAAFAQVDLEDRQGVARVFDQYPVEAIMHFAAYALVGESMREPALYYRKNFVCGLNLLEAAEKAEVPRFIFSSTCAVFGDQVKPPIPVDAPKNPVNPYGESKLAFEKALEWSRRIHGTTDVVLRYFNACGATPERGERRGEMETHLIPLVLAAAAGKRDSIKIMGTDYPTPDGTAIRDYVHVLDLADAHIRALDATPEQAGAYNLGVGQGSSVRQVIDSAKKITGRDFKVFETERRPGDPPELVGDPSKAQETFGWRATRSLDDAVRDAWAWESRSL